MFEGVVYHCHPLDLRNPCKPTLEVDARTQPGDLDTGPLLITVADYARMVGRDEAGWCLQQLRDAGRITKWMGVDHINFTISTAIDVAYHRPSFLCVHQPRRHLVNLPLPRHPPAYPRTPPNPAPAAPLPAESRCVHGLAETGRHYWPPRLVVWSTRLRERVPGIGPCWANAVEQCRSSSTAAFVE